MTETPKCPYCGEKMALKVREEPKNKWNARYICNKCHSTGPYANECQEKSYAEEVALAYTLHRAEPEMRPLTLEEIYAKIDDEDWNVVWIEGPDSQKAEPMCPYYKEENKIIFCAPPFVRVWEETISRYGKSWRCWPRKPTPEQMAAEKWEE